MRLLVLGNPHIPEDTLAIEVAKELQGVSTKHVEDLNALLDQEYDALLDVAKGIDKVTLIHDMNQLKEHHLFSLHDYDVTFFLKLMKEMGEFEKKPIIAIPVHYDKEKAIKEVIALLPKTI